MWLQSTWNPNLKSSCNVGKKNLLELISYAVLAAPTYVVVESTRRVCGSSDLNFDFANNYNRANDDTQSQYDHEASKDSGSKSRKKWLLLGSHVLHGEHLLDCSLNIHTLVYFALRYKSSKKVSKVELQARTFVNRANLEWKMIFLHLMPLFQRCILWIVSLQR